MRFIKSALTVAIAMASTGTMAAASGTVGTNVDGYNFSGHTARSQALQLDYFAGHQDSGDIFVNPALVGKYGNRVAINADNGNNGANGDGGVFFQNGVNTFGVYIGRDSAANFAGNVNQLYRNINGQNLTSEGVGQQNPQSQFDLFYGFDTDAFAIGARLNYQANEQKDSDAPYTTGLPNNFSSIDEFLNYRAANLTALNATVPNYQVLPYVGTLMPSTTAERWKYEANELNLSVGFALKELNIDGALVYGKASGSFKTNESGLAQTVRLLADPSDANKQLRYTTGTDQWSDSTTYDLDKGTTLGLSLRGQVFETQDSKLTLSGSFIKQDYSVNYSQNFSSTEKEYSGIAHNDNDLEFTTTDTYAESGTLKDERTAYQLLGAFEKTLDENTKLTVFSGFKYTEVKNGYSQGVVTNMSHEIDHTDGDKYENTYNGTVGTSVSEFGKNEFTSIPLVIAVEHSFNERWTGRAAVSRDLYRNFKTSWTDDEFNATLQPDTIPAPDANAQDQSTVGGPVTRYRTNAISGSYESTWANQPTTATIGLGYVRGNFNIDTVLGNDFFTQGTNNGVFGAASLGYKF